MTTNHIPGNTIVINGRAAIIRHVQPLARRTPTDRVSFTYLDDGVKGFRDIVVIKMSDKACPKVIDQIGSLGRESRIGEVCGELLMAPMPAGTPGDSTYYCERCGLDVRPELVEA